VAMGCFGVEECWPGRMTWPMVAWPISPGLDGVQQVCRSASRALKWPEWPEWQGSYRVALRQGLQTGLRHSDNWLPGNGHRDVNIGPDPLLGDLLPLLPPSPISDLVSRIYSQTLPQIFICPIDTKVQPTHVKTPVQTSRTQTHYTRLGLQS